MLTSPAVTHPGCTSLKAVYCVAHFGVVTMAVSGGNQGQQSMDPAQWVDHHGDALYRYAVTRLRSADAAEDVVQETFLAALRARDQYRGRGLERAWLMGICRRKVVDYVRRRNRAGVVSGEVEGRDPSEVLFDQAGHWRSDPRFLGRRPEETLEREEFWQAFRTCLAGLSQRQADVFAMRELENMTAAEICKELEISTSNLWVLLHRARLGLTRCLRSHLESWGWR